jgi:hypothetical protein
MRTKLHNFVSFSFFHYFTFLNPIKLHLLVESSVFVEESWEDYLYWQKTDKKFPYSAENTGMTFAPVKTFEPYISSTPSSVQMKLPS